MAKKFDELRKRMSPQAQESAEQRKQELLREMPLQELRQALAYSQADIAAILNVKQSSVSKIERETDMYISTLRRFIQAMGGTLDLVARFPDGEVKINHFKEYTRKEHDDDSAVA
jgi:transcriptional regulator with XRE-family HTH domain